MALCVRVRRTLYISDVPLCVIENPQIRTRERGQRWLILLRLFFPLFIPRVGGEFLRIIRHWKIKNRLLEPHVISFDIWSRFFTCYIIGTRKDEKSLNSSACLQSKFPLIPTCFFVEGMNRIDSPIQQKKLGK